MEELEASVRKLTKEEEELHQALRVQEEQASVTLLEETHKVQLQNQELQQQVPEPPTSIHAAPPSRLHLVSLTPEPLLSSSWRSCSSRVWSSTT